MRDAEGDTSMEIRRKCLPIAAAIAICISFAGGLAFSEYRRLADPNRGAKGAVNDSDADSCQKCRKELEELRSQVAWTRVSIEQLETLVDERHAEFAAYREALDPVHVKVLKDLMALVELDPNNISQFGVANTRFGSLLVSCKEVVPHLNGFRVTLRIGNPLNTDFVGFKIQAHWGSRYSEDRSNFSHYLRWMRSLRKQDIAFTQTLKAGAWTQVSMILPDTGARELESIVLSLNVSTVKLDATLDGSGLK